MNHVCAVLGIAHRIVRDISLGVPKGQIVARIQHAAVSITASVNEILLGFLGSGAEHLRAVKVLGQQGFRNLRTEVAEIDAEGVAAVCFDVVQGIYHINFGLDDGHRAFVNVFGTVLPGIGLDQGLSAVDCQRSREAVTAYGNDTDFYGAYIQHSVSS